MSIRDYFKPNDGLPHPKVSLSVPQAITLVNKEVEKAINEKGGKPVAFMQGEIHSCSEQGTTCIFSA